MRKSDTIINILLADDDQDDCLLFKGAVADLPLASSVETVRDGEQLIEHLVNTSANLPDLVFLDHNMPRKNGFECLTEIKNHPNLKNLPVIIYSTSYDEEKAHQLFNKGAHYYICKPSAFEDLKKVIYIVLQRLRENASQPAKQFFLINKFNEAI